MSSFTDSLNALRASKQSQPAEPQPIQAEQPVEQEAQPSFADRLNSFRTPQESSAPDTEPSPPSSVVPSEPREKEKWYEDFGEGLGVSALGTYYGIKDLVVGMDDEDMATLKDWKDDAAQSGWGTAGEIVGEIAQIALPAGVATKGLKVLSKAKTLGRTVPMLVDALSTGALNAIKVPKEGESRADAALEGITDSLTGGVLFRALSKATRGVDITDYAKTILDNGGFLTAGKAAKSKSISGLESVAEVTPFLAKAVEKAQEKAKTSWGNIVTKEAAPLGAKITARGQQGIKQLSAAYDDAYSAAWAKADKISNQGRVAFVDAASDGLKYLPKNEANRVVYLASEFKNVLKELTPKNIKAYDNRLRRAIDSIPYDNRAYRDTLKAMREALRKGLPEDALKSLKEVDGQYAKYLVVKKATAAAAGEAGGFTPSQLINAVKSVGGVTRTAMGDAPLQEIATAGKQTIGKKLGGQPLEWFRRIAGSVPSPVPVQTLSNMVIGQNPLQKAARKTIESETVDALRKYMPRSGQVSGAYLKDE